MDLTLRMNSFFFFSDMWCHFRLSFLTGGGKLGYNQQKDSLSTAVAKRQTSTHPALLPFAHTQDSSQISWSPYDVIAGPLHIGEERSWFPLQIRTRNSVHSLLPLYVYYCLKRKPTVNLSYLTRPSLARLGHACGTDKQDVDLISWRTRADFNPVDS